MTSFDLIWRLIELLLKEKHFALMDVQKFFDEINLLAFRLVLKKRTKCRNPLSSVNLLTSLINLS